MSESATTTPRLAAADTVPVDVARKRITTLLDVLPEEALTKALARVTNHDFSKSTSAEIVAILLTRVDLAAPAPVVKRSVKAALLADARTLATAAAVHADANLTLDEKKARVLAHALHVLEASGGKLVKVTPGFASGKHWAPEGKLPTSGSAVYSRFNVKYFALGYQALVPLYVDERAVASKAIWQQRKTEALEIEKHLHTVLEAHEQYKTRYEGQEGGAEPAYSATTHFYVYLAIKEK